MRRSFTEVQAQERTTDRAHRDIAVDGAVELYLDYLQKKKGRTAKTIGDYRGLHVKWASPAIGDRRLRDVTISMLDDVFAPMQVRSASRINEARSLYVPLFRWAKKQGIISRDPMVGFEWPTSSYVSDEKVPPEVDEVALILNVAVELTPEIAPVLALDAVANMRRGEVPALRRSSINWTKRRLKVDHAVDSKGELKPTKTRSTRYVHIDDETAEMLRRHCEDMDRRAAASGTEVGPDGFVFSLHPDCSRPMPPDFITKQVAVIKRHLGIEDKKPETIMLEDEALRLYRQPPEKRPAGRTGPMPKGGLSYAEIGTRLGRSERWAANAVAAAELRERVKATNLDFDFDGSFKALRAFGDTELLEAGFSIGMVGSRQGHSVPVLMQNYAKRRRSADRNAAGHLGRVVNEARRVQGREAMGR